MTNVHRLVVPERKGPQPAEIQASRRVAEILILPCIRYERMDSRDTHAAKRGSLAGGSHEMMPQDLTA